MSRTDQMGSSGPGAERRRPAQEMVLFRMRKSALWWVGLGTLAARVAAAEITLPPETSKLVESPLPGYAVAQAMCLTCHSADYIQYQPASTRAYWQAATVKMQKTFGAPIPDSAVAPLVDYLAKTYGNERTAGNTGGAPTKALPKPADQRTR